MVNSTHIIYFVELYLLGTINLYFQVTTLFSIFKYLSLVYTSGLIKFYSTLDNPLDFMLK